MVRKDHTPSLSSLLSIPETQARVGGGPVFLRIGKKSGGPQAARFYANTVCTSTMYKMVPPKMLSRLLCLHRWRTTTAATEMS